MAKRQQWASVSLTFSMLGPSDDTLAQLDSYSEVTSVEVPEVGRCTVTLAVDGDAVVATAFAAERAQQWSHLMGPLLKTDVTDGAELQRENEETEILYGGVAEVAEMLGVSKQRVIQILADHEAAPPPIARLRSGPVWNLADWTRFLQTWDRRSGRPPRERHSA